ncbi:peptide/nickel transport system ATP-binding protein [Gemmobacter megaterium]|uniref:Glutathione import ATP-binding protein GsiA n=1 Tax=Gemmobacter megaterium TaxID=1086013 RepID=A0A1N7PXL9_9RHOB|nr:ATP-binding cassette domain-containing protein [Gemmobacter megaterium]GGE22094.1 ABC transporter ATP-binding protein [Gemmobacter megaterium]SIT15342.1 peptide/nickel transport system ATP-binding protein [Gemmobacter megaterium]
MTAPILEIDDLHVHFPVTGGGLLGTGRKTLHAVNGLSLHLNKGECLSLVGESGCGKSTTALAVMGLQEPTSGSIRFRGQPFSGPEAPGRMDRARAAQIVFQDPYASLNPRQTVWASLAAPLRLHGVTAKSEVEDRIATMLKSVGLSAEQGRRFPHEFSGGQRQRIGIARALILGPEIVVLDEPVSALDVSIRAQIINLLLDLQDQFGLSYLMISHDLSVVEHMSDRVAVMFFGEIVETGPWQSIFTNPIHPYCRRLIATIPDPDVILGRSRKPTDGEQPDPPAGWRFADTGLESPDLTKKPDPSELVEVEPDHFVRLARI